MVDVYAQHDKAFAQVSAYVILKGSERVATVALKHSRDGAGRLYTYVHWLGTPMVRGYAGGGGYDKGSAACASAASKMEFTDKKSCSLDVDAFERFRSEMAKNDGWYWYQRLEAAGFTVLQAI